MLYAPLGNPNPNSVSTASDKSELALNCDLKHLNAFVVETDLYLVPRVVAEEVSSVVNNKWKTHVDEGDVRQEVEEVESFAPAKTDLEREQHVSLEVTSQKLNDAFLATAAL